MSTYALEAVWSSDIGPLRERSDSGSSGLASSLSREADATVVCTDSASVSPLKSTRLEQIVFEDSINLRRHLVDCVRLKVDIPVIQAPEAQQATIVVLAP